MACVAAWPPQGAATQAAAAPTAHRHLGLQVLFGDPVLECICEPFTTSSRNQQMTLLFLVTPKVGEYETSSVRFRCSSYFLSDVWCDRGLEEDLN